MVIIVLFITNWPSRELAMASLICFMVTGIRVLTLRGCIRCSSCLLSNRWPCWFGVMAGLRCTGGVAAGDPSIFLVFAWCGVAVAMRGTKGSVFKVLK